MNACFSVLQKSSFSNPKVKQFEVIENFRGPRCSDDSLIAVCYYELREPSTHFFILFNWLKRHRETFLSILHTQIERQMKNSGVLSYFSMLSIKKYSALNLLVDELNLIFIWIICAERRPQCRSKCAAISNENWRVCYGFT